MKELFKLQAEICKTMANPVRMEIIYALKDGEKSAGELVDITGLMKSPRVTLKTLLSNISRATLKTLVAI